MSLYEFEYETAQQSEAFYESVVTAARSGTRHRQLARTAMAAARAALIEGNKACAADAECEDEFFVEGEWESPAYYHQSFTLAEAIPSAMLMEHLGHGAAEAESDGEAFAFLAPLLPMAMKALPLIAKGAVKFLPKIASTVMKVAPKVMKGMQGAAKALRTNPVTKPLVRALPNVVRQTTADIARQIAAGQPVTAQTAVRTFAKNTANVLSDPRRVVRAVNAAQKTDQRVHRALAAPPNAAAAAPANWITSDAATGYASPIVPASKPCSCQHQ
ncbi:MAG TPA: hypothetical protein VF111_07550 [Thermoanaerobaculia bacterium]